MKLFSLLYFISLILFFSLLLFSFEQRLTMLDPLEPFFVDLEFFNALLFSFAQLLLKLTLALLHQVKLFY